MDKQELQEILDKHAKWLKNEEGGKRANIQGANLRGADLQDANLRGANLWGADLRDAKNIPEHVLTMINILPDGDIIGWKKAHINNTPQRCLVKLLIPADAKRSNATGRKCRAEFAKVLGFEMIDGSELPDGADVKSNHDNSFVYPAVGEIVRPDEWDDDHWNECSHGIHFFITRYEAENY